MHKTLPIFGYWDHCTLLVFLPDQLCRLCTRKTSPWTCGCGGRWQRRSDGPPSAECDLSQKLPVRGALHAQILVPSPVLFVPSRRPYPSGIPGKTIVSANCSRGPASLFSFVFSRWSLHPPTLIFLARVRRTVHGYSFPTTRSGMYQTHVLYPPIMQGSNNSMSMWCIKSLGRALDVYLIYE
jgi:hypothetical protein